MAKHGLKNDGAPFDDDGKLVNSDKSTKGEGRGVCICGEHSDVLPSRAARKRWHDWHKENLPSEPTLDDELKELASADIEEEYDLIGGDEEEDLVGDDSAEVTVTVPWTKELAGIFWGICGNAGSKKVLAAYHPEVKANAVSGEKALALTGQREHVLAAQETVLGYWAAAAKDFKRWKKETPAYFDRDQTDPAQRRVGHQLTKSYFTDFAEGYASGKVNAA